MIGAGIAGLAAARTLKDQGFAVRVLERGRGVGGRAAHRQTQGHHFDHGAQYFTARDPRFARCVEAWLSAGVVAPWKGRIVALGKGEGASTVAPLERYVGVPGMNVMAKRLARGVEVTTDCAVTALSRNAGTWVIKTNAGSLGPFDAVILAMPPEQAAQIDAPGALLDAAKRFESLPCWCAMAAFDAPLPLDFDGAFVNSAEINWAARDSSKPGRPKGERWVIHASAKWSAGCLDESPGDIARALLGHLFHAFGLSPLEPKLLAGHRWSFARPARDSEVDCVWMTEHSVALCGDWCRNGRVEGAYLSGVATAGRVVDAAVGHHDKR